MDAVKKKLAILKEEKEAAVAHAEEVDRQKKDLQDQLDKVRANGPYLCHFFWKTLSPQTETIIVYCLSLALQKELEVQALHSKLRLIEEDLEKAEGLAHEHRRKAEDKETALEEHFRSVKFLLISRCRVFFVMRLVRKTYLVTHNALQRFSQNIVNTIHCANGNERILPYWVKIQMLDLWGFFANRNAVWSKRNSIFMKRSALTMRMRCT